MNSLKKYFNNTVWNRLEKRMGEVTEIRIRVNQPLIIEGLFGEEIFEEIRLSPKEIEEIFERITNFSVYAYEKELREGYLTLPGGHRVGLAGEAVYSDGKLQGMKHIRFMNFRICHYIEGYGKELVSKLLDERRIKNTLIISRPGMGKTTL